MMMTALPPLPPGWTPNVQPHTPAAASAEPPPYVDEQPPPRMPTSHAPPQSGVLTTVTGTSGWAVTLHRAEYQLLSTRGEFTSHGYAWRCTNPACRRITTGYPAEGFGRALEDARWHDCTEARCG